MASSDRGVAALQLRLGAASLGITVFWCACTLPDVNVDDKRGSAEMQRDAGDPPLTDAGIEAGSESHAGTKAPPTVGGAGGDKSAAANGGAGGTGGTGNAAPATGSAGSGGSDQTDKDGESEPNQAASGTRGWTAAAKLPVEMGSANVQHGVDSAGRITLMWENFASPNVAHTYTSRYVDAVWSAPRQMAEEGNFARGLSSLATDDAGRAVVTYLRELPGTPMPDLDTSVGQVDVALAEVYAVNMSADGIWSAAHHLKQGLQSSKLALNDQGTAVVASINLENAPARYGWEIWSSRATQDSDWGEPMNIDATLFSEGESDTEQEEALKAPTWLSLATNRNGRAMALWKRKDSVFALEVGQPVGDHALIEEPSEPDAPTNATAIASDDADRSIAVWTHYDGTHVDLHSRRYIRGTGWEPVNVLEQSDAGDVKSPRLQMDKQGNAMVVWTQSDGTTTAVWYNRYELGKGWGGAQRIEPPNPASNVQSTELAMDDSGNVLVAWIDLGAVRVARYVGGQGWEPIVKVNETAQPAERIHLSMSGSGIGMLTWQDESKNHWFSRFE